MALPIRPNNFNNQIPNNPFYSPETTYFVGPYYPSIVDSASGIGVNPDGTISVTGGGGGGGAVGKVSGGTGITVTPSTGTGNVTVTNTGVLSLTAGSGISITGSTGNITISSSIAGGTVTNVIGSAPISVVSGTTTPIISVATASTTTSGVTTLVNNLTTNDSSKALTAAQGYQLQQQISSLVVAGGLTLAGTFNPATQQLVTVTSAGSSKGFTAGLNLPAPAVGNNNYFVIATTSGTYTPPGGSTPLTITQGDWLLSNGTNWSLLDVGFNAPAATTTTAGVVRLSTTAEAQAGTDSTIALTPASVAASYIPRACVTAKGTLVAGTAANTPFALPIGTVGQVLTVDPACSTGMKWAAPTGGGGGGTGTVTSVATGPGLTGGTITTAGTLDLVNRGITPGTFSNPSVTVNCYGVITGITSGGAAIPCSLLTAKGQVIGSSAASTPVALGAGVDGYILAACSAAVSGLCWVPNPAASAAIPCSAITGKGAILTGSAANAPTALPLGVNGAILSVNPACTTGLEWVLPSNGGTVPPATPAIGELWYDTTSTPPILKAWDGTNWTSVTLTGSTTAPTSPSPGQTWINTSVTPPAEYIWNGTNWTLTNFTGSDTPPTSPVEGQTWMDTTASPPIQYVWNGTQWVPTSYTGNLAAPVNPINGQTWVNTSLTPPAEYIWNGTAWIPTGSVASNTAPTSPILGQIWNDTSGAAPVLKTWDGSSWIPQSVTVDTVAPTSPVIGQVWSDTSGPNPVLKSWDGSNWTAVGTGTVTSVVAGSGLNGGTITTSGTISLANTTVTPGSYTYTNLTVDAQGRITAASSGASPTGGTVTNVATGTGLTGGPITSTGTIALANTSVTAGSYTYGSFTVDAQGRLTAASNGTSPVTSITAGTGLNGGIITNVGTISLANTAVTAGTYNYATLTVDAQGRLTAASSGISPVTSITAGTGLSGGTITSTGTVALANTSVTPGTYNYATLTVDAQGRITAASSGASPTGGTVTSVTAGTGLSGGTITTTGTVALANTSVTAGSYTYGAFTVDAQGRLTAASSGLAPVTAISGTSPIGVVGGTTPVVSICSASTTQAGAVQLYDGLNSTSTTQALTAAQGKALQDQIDSLANSGGLQLAGTINASTGLIVTVTSAGTTDGFVVGNGLPAANLTTNNDYVIVTTAGTFTPPGGVSTTATQGDWFLVSETSPGVYSWTYLNVGYDPVYATTTQCGVVCLATNAQAQAGTDANLALTPASAAAAYIPKTCITNKGTIITGTAASTPVALPIGGDGQVLTACSTATSGLCWAPASVPAIPCACLTAKGAIVTATAAGTPSPLTVGTDGQILVACSTATNGLCWSTISYPYIPNACITAKGTLVTGTAASTPSALPVGTDGQILTACSTSLTGLAWATAPAPAIPCACVTAKGALITGTAASTPVALPVGGDGCALIACAACTTGLTWASVAVSAATPVVAGIILGCTVSNGCGTALGCNALLGRTTGTGNVGVGHNAGCAITSGINNTAIGACAGDSLTTPSWNVLVGASAGCSIVTGCGNVAVGTSSGCIATGACSVFIGLNAGDNATTGSQNVLIGACVQAPVAAGSCQLAIGFSNADVWLTGCSNRNIRPGAGILDCSGSAGTVGQVLVSTGGNAICWQNPVNPVVDATPTTAGIIKGCTNNACCNTMLGCNAGLGAIAVQGVFIGCNAGCAGVTGCRNVLVGACAGVALTSGTFNVVVGSNAASTLSTGCRNVLVGSGTGAQLNTDCNTLIGHDAGINITTGACNVGVGTNALGLFTGPASTGSCNTAVGVNALTDITSGGVNVAVGFNAGANVTSGNQNNFFGQSAGLCLTTGCNNVLIGQIAGCSLVTGCNNVLLGGGAGMCATGSGQTLVGHVAGASITTGLNNTALGYEALGFINAVVANTGNANVAVGECSLRAITTGSNNTAVGFWTGKNATSATSNNLFGWCAGVSLTTGCFNVLLGHISGRSLTTGARNVMVGGAAGFCVTTASDNTFVGDSAGNCVTTGFNNIAIGSFSMLTGGASCCNVAVGMCALAGATSALGNTAIGHNSSRCVTTAQGNTALGWDSACSLTTGYYNVLLGQTTGKAITTGYSNVVVGANAGTVLSTGNCNTILGDNSGANITSGNRNVAIGANVQVASATGCCQLAIGFDNNCYWLTGDSNRNIRPGCGIIDCTGSVGLAGQALMTTGTGALMWCGGYGDTPVGAIMMFAANSIPGAWLVADGRAVSRATYPALFTAIGTTYGAGDGTSTFNLPDLRGQFLRGWDAAGGTARGCDASRTFGSSQGFAMQPITGKICAISETFALQAAPSVPVPGNALYKSDVGPNAFYTPSSVDTSATGTLCLNSSLVTSTACETRPMNVAMLPCIKWQVTSAPSSCGIPCNTLTAKGSIVTATAPDTPLALPVGADGLVLTANSSCPTGLAWAAPADTVYATALYAAYGWSTENPIPYWTPTYCTNGGVGFSIIGGDGHTASTMVMPVNKLIKIELSTRVDSNADFCAALGFFRLGQYPSNYCNTVALAVMTSGQPDSQVSTAGVICTSASNCAFNWKFFGNGWYHGTCACWGSWIATVLN